MNVATKLEDGELEDLLDELSSAEDFLNFFEKSATFF